MSVNIELLFVYFNQIMFLSDLLIHFLLKCVYNLMKENSFEFNKLKYWPLTNLIWFYFISWFSSSILEFFSIYFLIIKLKSTNRYISSSPSSIRANNLSNNSLHFRSKYKSIQIISVTSVIMPIRHEDIAFTNCILFIVAIIESQPFN